jgi:DNA-binding IclR family transcriptional regulator
VLIGKALERIRKIGFAQEDEQSEVGMRSVAAPIRNADGAVVAAVGLAGPMQRLPDKTMTKFAPLVADAANQISIRLGYRRST